MHAVKGREEPKAYVAANKRIGPRQETGEFGPSDTVNSGPSHAYSFSVRARRSSVCDDAIRRDIFHACSSAPSFQLSASISASSRIRASNLPTGST